MSFLLKPLNACNIDQLLNLENQSFTSDKLSRRSFRRMQKSSSAQGWGAFEGEKLVGYSLLLFRRNSAKARLYSLAVDREQRGRGIGRLLIESSARLARTRGCTSLHLEVSQTNSSAVDLYESLGFVRTGLRPGYYEDGNDAFVYRLDL